jgi:phosphosulfolactate synthase (CoM biosynthesis protein A)
MVSPEYLNKIKFAVRTVSTDTNVIREITDIIEECRADMVNKGVSREIAHDENDYSVLGCVRSFARSRFGIDANDIRLNMEDYRLQVDELRKAVAEDEDS